ncbi:MAG: EpsG family protein [Clostridiales bacterium]|nr:EpsG family protein [Clostridiales bacterium]
MLILIFLSAFSYFLALFSKKLAYSHKIYNATGQSLPHPISFALPLVLFTVFSGLRSGVGDTFFTMHAFSLLPENMERPYIFEKEFLYSLLVWFLRRSTENPQFLIFIGALFFCPAALYFLYKNSLYYELALFLFVATGYYTFSFNGMRQYMAAGILILGSKYLFSEEKTDLIKFALIVLLAFSFHSSALIMLPLYFLVRQKSFSLWIFILIFSAFLGLALFDLLLPRFLEILSFTDFSVYEESGWFTSGQEGGASLVRFFTALIPPILAYQARARLKKFGLRADVLINMSFVNLAFYILALYNWIFARFAIYTEIYNIVLITWLVGLAFKKRDRRLAYFLCVIFYILFFVGISYSVVEYRSDFFRTVF